MHKYLISQKDKQKNCKKTGLKILSNYIPIKKTHFQSNISEYETESSIQKNFSNKYVKKHQKPNLQAKSVNIIHSNQFSPDENINNNINKEFYSNNNKLSSNRGSFYNLNYLNNYDYSNEKKLIENKNKKINSLQKQLSLYLNQINLIEKNNKAFGNIQHNSNHKTSNVYNISHSANKNNPKILYINKNNNKYLLINNNSYVGFSSNKNNEKIIGVDIVDKKLEKKLSNFLTENNSGNNFKNKYMNQNKNNILNIIYQSKKGRFKQNNINCNKNNYIINFDNKNIQEVQSNKQSNSKKESSFKNNNNNICLFEKDKNNYYFYTNKEHEKKISLIENKNSNNESETLSNIDLQYKNLNDRIINLFNCFFDYYNQKTINQQ